MPLETPNAVDVIRKKTDGTLELVITDSGVTTDPSERFGLFMQKLSCYTDYLLSTNFSETYGDNFSLSNVGILVMHRTEPTKEMLDLQFVNIQHSKHGQVSVPISFLHFTPH